MNLFNIFLYVVAIYMVVRTIIMSKQTKKNRALIEAMQSIHEEDEFVEKINAIIESEEGKAKAKAQVIKLWGISFHERYVQFERVLDEIQIDDLFTMRNGTESIAPDEDSFVYLYLAIPEILYSHDQTELRDYLRTVLQPYSERLNDQVCVVLSQSMDQFFEKKEDLGLNFCEKLLNGDYEGYQYSKSMIGLYKSIAAAQAAKIYQLNGETDKYDELVPMLQEFGESGLGSRWLKGLDLTVNSEQVLEDPEEKTTEDEE